MDHIFQYADMILVLQILFWFEYQSQIWKSFYNTGSYYVKYTLSKPWNGLSVRYNVVFMVQ